MTTVRNGRRWAWAAPELGRLREEPLDEQLARMTPPTWRSLIPWLLMLIAPGSDVVGGDVTPRWLATLGLVAFAGLYVATVRSSLGPGGDEPPGWYGPQPRRLLAALTVLTCALAGAWGGNWLLLFVLVALAGGTMLRGRPLRVFVFALCISSVLLAMVHGESIGAAMSYSYGPLISGLVTAAVTSLFTVVERLRETREELARSAVEQERLRFSRDLHDLLGHTLSVIVVKSEAVRRLAPRDVDAALAQAADIEAVGRQALTEIREAVAGYRQVSLSGELDRARSLLTASGVEPVVRQSGPPLPPQTEALLGWVVREGVTNVVRHSGATRCEITVRGDAERVRMEVVDDGHGPTGTGTSGYGLKGLAERIAAAGGTLEYGPAGRHGFRLVAELPADEEAG
ncbi:sensor histidine kinase [Streptomyces sp. NPDC051940]|uniref:sensor histidine kinase n=1 Tax=Streptomyces sp. NPDC051940 TaxID=3155675 RepID=UPI00343338A9